MRPAAVLAAISLTAIAAPVAAQPEPIRPAIVAGLSLCRAWVEGVVAKTVTKPTFDADGFAARTVGLIKLDRVGSLPIAILPPQAARFMTDYWHLDAGPGAGVFVAASRFMTRCEVAGGGSVDFQPIVATEVGSPAFLAEWTIVDQKVDRAIDMATTHYRLAKNKREDLLLSRATAAHGRTNRAQFFATLMYRLRN